MSSFTQLSRLIRIPSIFAVKILMNIFDVHFFYHRLGMKARITQILSQINYEETPARLRHSGGDFTEEARFLELD